MRGRRPSFMAVQHLRRTVMHLSSEMPTEAPHRVRNILLELILTYRQEALTYPGHRIHHRSTDTRMIAIADEIGRGENLTTYHPPSVASLVTGEIGIEIVVGRTNDLVGMTVTDGIARLRGSVGRDLERMTEGLPASVHVRPHRNELGCLVRPSRRPVERVSLLPVFVYSE